MSRYPPVIQYNIGWKSPLSYAIYRDCGFSMAMLFLAWRARGTLFTSLNPGILDQDDQVKATSENSPSSFATKKRNSRCFIEIPRFPQLISIHIIYYSNIIVRYRHFRLVSRIYLHLFIAQLDSSGFTTPLFSMNKCHPPTGFARAQLRSLKYINWGESKSWCWTVVNLDVWIFGRKLLAVEKTGVSS